MFLGRVRKLGNSLVFRLTILYAVTFASLSTTGFLFLYYRIYTVSMERLDSELLDETRKYANLMEESGPQGIKDAIIEDGKYESAKDGFYRLFDINGHTLTSTDMSIWKGIGKRDILIGMQHAGKTYDIRTLTPQDQNDKVRTITAIIRPGHVMQIGENLEEINDYMDILLKWFSMLVISLIAASTVIGWLLARRATADMQAVTRTAENISNGAYEQRVQVKGRFNEIKRLGETFNNMLDRINGLLKSMKEINDNIAHDLRSPLARIRGIAEMHLINQSNMDNYKEMAASTIEECDTLIEMINTMLNITEAEAGVNGVEKEHFELVDLIQEACELFGPIAEHKKITLVRDLPESLTVVSDRKKMQRIVTNLLENAIKYTPQNNSVTVAALTCNGEIVINVQDTGMGISEKDLPHIFDRFYRCDQSRSQGGVGLGLSLVKAYTVSLNGSIHVQSTFNQGSIFTLTIPRGPVIGKIR